MRFSKLSLIDQLFHTVASPPVAYLLFLIGLALLIFEFFTAGVGVAGCRCRMHDLACYGLAALPARWWAVALLVAGMVAFAVDVQVGVPRSGPRVGIVLTIIGSFWLFEPVPGASLRPSWITPDRRHRRHAAGVRGRHAVDGADPLRHPDDRSRVDDRLARGCRRGRRSRRRRQVGEAQWQARTNRATPIKAGDQVRVTAIDGVTLEVEPLEGAAKDHRERRASDGAKTPPG